MQTQASHDMNHPTFHHRPLLLLLLLSLTLLSACASTPIRGTQKADPERMYQYVASRNPDFSREVAQAFYEIGELYGIRGDIALCQAIIETGWFRFDNGTAVLPSAHNYCGLGVKRRGDKGCSFKSVREGVTAMIQHLYAYSCRDAIPDGEDMLDPRFSFVTRGSATSWEALSGRWAMNRHYGRNILNIYKKMLDHEVTPMIVQVIEVDIPDHLMADDEMLHDNNFFE